MPKILLLLSVLTLLFSNAYAETKLQKLMVNELSQIERNFKNFYAPKDWKKEYAGWDLQKVMAGLKEKVKSNPQITIKKFHQIVREFFNSTIDYHVGVRFQATESASLPLLIKEAEGKFILAYINRDSLSKASFPFEVGDEVVSFNGQPTLEAVKKVAIQSGTGNSPLTDRALALMTLTSRKASKGDTIPKGKISIGLKKQKDGKIHTRQLSWKYEKESVDYSGIEKRFAKLSPLKSSKKKVSNFDKEMISINALDFDLGDNPFSIGGRKSFIPQIGEKIWETGKDEPFHAYIYMNEDHKLIGYVRISSYSVSNSEKYVEHFAKIIKKFEKITDSMVIDQVNNPGGSVFYLYTLVSMLSDKAMATPRHHMNISPKDAMNAISGLKELEKLKTDEEAKKFLGNTISGYPVDMTFVSFTQDYFRFILDAFSSGEIFTSPSHLWGADMIHPSLKANYTKPILILVNELDFSGGDFFPAIMQDNNRVKILGTKTAGAGGYVLQATPNNLLGIARYTYTGSLAKRVNNNPIENLGVTPDIEYKLTLKDYQSNFSEYIKIIQTTINQMAK